ncbi:glucose 1-dehydrogenase [Parabacteroides distasonis]|uniref:glucose 1-dehydrogenase n=1 Tax=Parabacteroides distasonis TaxID=823 RepID=UPI00189947EF|nr:glucose 1-dehydrogenase [Parabacteroides distasonis]MDB8997679.1 glucose 1-dehydrogenase [Parabacteroides distasonis]MDB9070089.1 glucose 1-dehydrogenase [Parabacteroides distasonis]
MKKIISTGMILILLLFAGQAFAQSTRLNNKIALVTGAASGNGKAIATLFAQEKAKVVLVDINKVTLDETVASLSKQGFDVTGVEADVTKEADIQKMVDTALSKYGRLDILVNNAGIFDELIPVGEVSDDLWYKIMETNLNAPMRGIRKVIPIFEKQGGGVIVNTASIAGFTGARGGGAAYVASKHALIGLTQNVAFNYKEKNIRCNAVAPGRVETNLRINSEKLVGSKTVHDQSIDKWKDIEDKITEGYITNMRKCTPDEIAKVVLFLASDEASFVNGSIFVADGGWTSY